MPELPDLEYIVSALGRVLPGRRIQQARVKNPIVLRLGIPGTLQDVCIGQAFGRCRRHGHFVVLRVGEAYELIVNPMLAGRFRLCGRDERNERSVCLAFGLDHGEELRYLDDKQMGKAYLVPAGDRSVVPGFDAVGIDPLSPDFTVDRLREIVCSRRDQVRAFLLDKTAVAAIPPNGPQLLTIPS
jgi:formamidopyrimidine-DNA glycosylase